jgi:hypothetical protein
VTTIRYAACALLWAALAAPSPAVEGTWRQYPEFGHVSGLPGNGFGVNANGQVGFGGALNMNVPCAYTPSQGNYVAAYHSASVNSGIELGFGGDNVDGSLFYGIGFMGPGSGIYVSEFFPESCLAVNTFNLQCQIQPESPSFPALAVGCIDLQSRRPAVVGGLRGGRSIYLTATKQAIPGDHALYLTLGYGGGRYRHNLFGAASWYMGRDLNVGLEYDGMVTTPHATCQLYQRGPWSAAANVSWGGFDHPDVGVTITRGK